MIKINDIKFLGPVKLAILSDGSDIQLHKILGNPVKDSTLVLKDGVYSVGK